MAASARGILVSTAGWSPEDWIERVKRHLPGRPVIDARAPFDPAEVGYAMAWKPPRGLIATCPNLKVIFSLGAGVDHLIFDTSLPDVPVVRIVDPSLTNRMTEWIVLHALLHLRQQKAYDAQQRDRVWYDRPQPAAGDVRVGVMGLGVLGQDAAEVLVRLGFQVAGWSRTPKTVDGIETYHGADGLAAFLARTDMLVVLLPHTSDTDGILNADLFRQLPRDGALGGAVLINAGRGRLQRAGDILAALERGDLMAASLDVFEVEPLEAESPLWPHPAVYVTPHSAASSDPRFLVGYVTGQIEAYERGERLKNVIDRATGY